MTINILFLKHIKFKSLIGKLGFNKNKYFR